MNGRAVRDYFSIHTYGINDRVHYAVFIGNRGCHANCAVDLQNSPVRIQSYPYKSFSCFTEAGGISEQIEGVYSVSLLIIGYEYRCGGVSVYTIENANSLIVFKDLPADPVRIGIFVEFVESLVRGWLCREGILQDDNGNGQCQGFYLRNVFFEIGGFRGAANNQQDTDGK